MSVFCLCFPLRVLENLFILSTVIPTPWLLLSHFLLPDAMEGFCIRPQLIIITFLVKTQNTDPCYCPLPSPLASLMDQTVKRLSTMRETRFWALGWEDPLEKEMAIHSRTIAWRIPWTEEPGRLQSMGSQRVQQDWGTSLSFPFLHPLFSDILFTWQCWYHSFYHNPKSFCLFVCLIMFLSFLTCYLSVISSDLIISESPVVCIVLRT